MEHWGVDIVTATLEGERSGQYSSLPCIYPIDLESSVNVMQQDRVYNRYVRALTFV